MDETRTSPESSPELDRRPWPSSVSRPGPDGERRPGGVADVLERLGLPGRGHRLRQGKQRWGRVRRRAPPRSARARCPVAGLGRANELAGDAGANFQIVRRSGIPMECSGLGTIPSGWRHTWRVRRGLWTPCWHGRPG